VLNLIKFTYVLQTYRKKLPIDLTGIITIVSATAGFGTAIYGVVFGLKNYKQKVKQDKMGTLLQLINEFQSENLTYAKKILDFRIIRPEKTWKNSVYNYNIIWQDVLQGHTT
jgi:hypothetical protein